MSSWQSKITSRKAISGLLIFALLFSLVSQAHLHLHHGDHHDHATIDETVHPHTTDVHTSYDNSHAVNHSEVQVMSLLPDVSLKYMNNDMQDMPLIGLYILLMVIPFIKRVTQVSQYRSQRTRENRYHNLPALRAPPVLS